MAKYIVDFEKTIYMARGTQSDELNPLDYLDYLCEDDLREAIINHFYENVYSEGDIETDESESNVIIPEGFIKEWQRLVLIKIKRKVLNMEAEQAILFLKRLDINPIVIKIDDNPVDYLDYASNNIYSDVSFLLKVNNKIVTSVTIQK